MNVLYCHDCVSGEWAVSDQSIECDPGQLSEIRHQTNISALTHTPVNQSWGETIKHKDLKI